MLEASSIAQCGNGPVPGLPFRSLPGPTQPAKKVWLSRHGTGLPDPDYRTLGSSTSLPPI